MTNYLKKLVTTCFVLAFAYNAFAPAGTQLVIIYPNPVDPFIRLVHAIGMVETQYDTLAFNPLEEAVGYFQIRPIRVKDYNTRNGTNYSMDDMFDYAISEKIFLYYASEIGPYDFEQIARKWNGHGKNTLQYWTQVKCFL